MRHFTVINVFCNNPASTGIPAALVIHFVFHTLLFCYHL